MMKIDDNTGTVESNHSDQRDISVTTLSTAISQKYHLLANNTGKKKKQSLSYD